MSMLLDALGYLGDTFDKPGRAVRGLLGGRPEELLAAVPFSDSMGLTDKANRVSGQDLTGLDDGSLLSTIGNIGVEVALDPLMFAGAGLGRMLGKGASAAAVARGPRFATTEDDVMRMAREFDAGPTMDRVKNTDQWWNDLTTNRRDEFGRELGPAAGGRRFSNNKYREHMGDANAVDRQAAVEAATVPPSAWAAMADDEARMTAALGMQQDTIAAINRNEVADLVAGGGGASQYGAPAANMLGYVADRSPADLARMLSEVAPNSKIIGMGNEAIAFRGPGGQVMRVEFPNFLQRGKSAAGTPGRPVAEGVLPVNSTTDIGNSFRVERTPFAENVGDKEVFKTRDPNTMLTKLDELDQTLAGSGLQLDDRILSNVGVYGGKPTVIDPGAIKTPEGVIGDKLRGYGGPRERVTTASDPGRLMNLLLNGIGSDDAVRTAYASGLSGPSFGRKLGTFGAAGGADAGILARLLSGD